MARSTILRCGFIMLVISAAVATAQNTDVSAAQFFIRSSNDVRKYVYIQVAPGQTLVFKEGDNSKYYLHGRALSIHADQVRIEGNVEIHSFSSDDHGGDKNVQKQYPADGPKAQNGLDNQTDGHGTKPPQAPAGVQGDIGGQGPTPLPMHWYVSKVVGVGEWSLLIDSSGGKGGHGQQGSDGLQGGRGGNGRDRQCPPNDQSPGNAGEGGDGGFGGQGGQCGPGGDGGEVQYTKTFCSLIAAKRISVKFDGGEPGDPGKGGRGGPGGSPGTAGAGQTCNIGIGHASGGNGASNGRSHESDVGPDGPPGEPGKPGTSLCSDCAKHACPSGSKPTGKSAKGI